MDVNGLRCWQVADATAFGLGAATGGEPVNLAWRAELRQLRLARQQTPPPLAENRDYAQAQAARPSPAADRGGSFAWWNATAGALLAGGFLPGSTPLALPPDVPAAATSPSDIAFGDDEILYVARDNAILMTDRRARFPDARVALSGFSPRRLCPASGGGVWALDCAAGTLARLEGVPLRDTGYTADDPLAFRPDEPNPAPPRLRLVRGARLPAGTQGVAIAASVGGRVAVLVWIDGQDAEIHTLDAFRLQRRFSLLGVRFPYGLAWLDEDRLAVLVSDGAGPAVNALVYDSDQVFADAGTAAALPDGDVYPLPGVWDGTFCNTLGEVPRYPVAGDRRDTPASLRALRAVSRATYARAGSVRLGPFDSGAAGTVWHRVQIEAALPEHAGLRVWAHADDTGATPPKPGAEGAPDWWPHLAGAAALPADADFADAPDAAWCDTPSEMAFNPGLLGCTPRAGRSGRFTVLLQRAGRRVRRLEGRWLYLTLELLGDSQATPEIAALRIYAARFSYRDRYLPALYHERLSGPDMDQAGAATPPDFLERFLSIFEAPLTELEGKVADSWLLTDPAATPEAALPWLASWIGVEPEDGAARAWLRQRLRAAPHTARLHGTLGGLLATLELATGGVVVEGGVLDPYQPAPRPGERALASTGDIDVDVLVLRGAGADGPPVVLAGGAVTRGEIVVVEGFRLRRTFATILGADLSDSDDPLTLGASVSGNSFVGDTLVLGATEQREVAALFAADMPQSSADSQAVAAFFAALAHTVLVLVRRSPRTRDIARLGALADAESPAHVQTRTAIASRPLIVGAASLVGVDTFLAPSPPVHAARIGHTHIGEGDRVMGSGRLDPRADGPAGAPPLAVADGPAALLQGTGFLLSSARSQAARGRTVARSIWTWLQ
ncbi:phage tail protein [Paraburkholderia atlantica]|uniref:phage tail protein n=1 Tax=Paraburkholderia atlantica TaxID=2654982 RepID=UPI003D1929AA